MTLKRPPLNWFRHRPELETLEDVGPLIGEPTIGLIEFWEDGHTWPPLQLFERFKSSLRLAGWSAAEFLLDHQANIPPEWHRFHLVFPGTIRTDSAGRLYVACLMWHHALQQWILMFPGGGSHGYRLVHFIKEAEN
jgi:hypothetical protein